MARVRMRTSEFKSKLKGELTQNMKEAGEFAERKIKQKLSGSRSGEMYTISEDGGSRRYQASAAGEPPAVRTGNLKASIESRMLGTTTPRVFVGSAVEYAASLELGTEKIEQRPYLRSTIRENSSKIAGIIANG